MADQGSLKDGIDALRGAVIDGRTENVRHRQNELHRLYAALTNNQHAICNAISSDSGFSFSNAEQEFYLTMDAIQNHYQTLDFDQSMKDEYLVKEGKENLNRRTRKGIVAIRPMPHTRFYSVITPLSAAIAAGNCVLLELENPHSKIDKILGDLLPAALDQDAFLTSSARLGESQTSEVDLLINQTNSIGRALAVVDRTANISLAAEAIATVRLPPHNTSPYVPDLVIVNDFVFEEFIETCLKNSDSIATPIASDANMQDLVGDAEKAGKITIRGTKTSSLKIIVVNDRSSPLLATKIIGPYILVLSTTSITDTITSQINSPTFIATYNFATPSVAKHLSQSISTHASFANHIPLPLLYGAVSLSPVSVHPRYTTENFSVPRPEFVAGDYAMPTGVKELKPTGQRKGHAIGYFEQGILIGLGLTVSVVFPVLGWGVWRVGKEGWRLAGRWR